MQHNDTRARRADRLRAALDYGARGVPVYPLVPGEKNPVIRRCPEAKRLKLTGAALAEHARTCPRDGHGFHDATTDPSRITAWFNRWPLANIGTPTGERSGILALDVDPDKGGDASLDALEAEDGKLPATRTHASGSGGTHYLLRYPEGSGIRNSAGKLASGLDIRGEGGYIVLPPSTTTGPYEVLDDVPLADPPAGLVEALKRLRGTRSGTGRGAAARGAAGPLSVDLDGPPIPDGTRHETLLSVCGVLHDGTRSLAQLTLDALAINQARCTPPLPVEEVEGIATWTHEREPCKPPSGPRATPEVLAMLDEYDRTVQGREWSAMGEHSTRSLLVTLSKIARKRGEVFGGTVRAVRVEASMREAVEGAAFGSTRTAHKAVSRARQFGLLRRDGTGRGTQRGAFLLVLPRAEGNTTPSGGVVKTTEDASVSPCAPPWTAPRLRWSAPGQRRLGKIAEKIIDTYEDAGEEGFSDEELAERIGHKRPRDLRRRYLDPLTEAGILSFTGDRRALSTDWREALDRRRVEDGEIAAAARQEQRHRDERAAFREAWARGEVISQAEFQRRRRNRDRIRPHERTPSGTFADLERVEDADPELVEALVAFLRRYPRRADERPSWYAVALWAEDYVEGKPPPEAVEVALYELRTMAA